MAIGRVELLRDVVVVMEVVRVVVSSILLVGIGETAVGRVVVMVVLVLVTNCSDNKLVSGAVKDGCTGVAEIKIEYVLVISYFIYLTSRSWNEFIGESHFSDVDPLKGPL